jgi:hypothetical protein
MAAREIVLALIDALNAEKFDEARQLVQDDAICRRAGHA